MLALGLAACSGKCSEAGSGPGPRPIEMLVPTDAETLDPRHATDAIALRATRLLHAGLVRLDPDTLEPRPYVARGWRWLAPDTLRVELRPGIRFHSGREVTADDVKKTIEGWRSPEVGSRHARVVEAIGAIDVENDRTIVFHLKRAHATLLTDLELPILRGDEAASPPRPDGTLDGLGPFVVVKRTHGEIVLGPAEHGALPPPAHAVVLRTVHDENARALRMHAGRADLVVNGFSPTLLPSFDGTALHVRARAGANLTYLMFRDGAVEPPLRQAITTAIDRDLVAKTLLAGRAKAAATLIPPNHWAHGALSPIPFDPARARAAVGGTRRKLTLLTSTDRLRGTIARVIAQELADVGIDVEVVPLELGTLLARLGAGDFELATLQMPEVTEPNVLRVFMHSTSIPPAGANRARLRDPEIDRLLDEGDAVNDPAERRAIYIALERRARDVAMFVPLWHEDQVAVASERARDFEPSAEGRWLGLASLP